MKILRGAVAILSLLLTAQSLPPDNAAIVVGNPVRVIKELGPDTTESGGGNRMLYLVRMRASTVIKGDFKGKYFNLIVSRHLPQYVFLNWEYVVLLKKNGNKYEVVEGNPINKSFCFSKATVEEHALKNWVGTPNETPTSEGGECWFWK